MKIAIVCTESSSFHSYTGGIGPRYEDLARRLGIMGHETYFVVTADNLLANFIPPRDFSLVTVPSGSQALRPLRDLVTAWNVNRVLQRIGPDLTVSAEWAGVLYFYTRAKTAGVTLTNVVTPTELLAEYENKTGGPRTRLTRRIRSAMERAQIARSHHVVYISEVLRSWFVGNPPYVPGPVLHNALDVARIEAMKSRSPDMGTADTFSRVSSRRVVVSVGRVCAWKGSDLLFQAAMGLWGNGYSFSLKFVGRVDAEECSAWPLMAAQAGGEVIFTDHLSQHEVRSHLKSADLAVFCSRFEGFGNAAVEAVLSGVPTIVSSNYGAAEVLRDGLDCLVVPDGSTEELAVAMKRILTDVDLAHRLRANRFSDLATQAFDLYPSRLLAIATSTAGDSASAEGVE